MTHSIVDRLTRNKRVKIDGMTSLIPLRTKITYVFSCTATQGTLVSHDIYTGAVQRTNLVRIVGDQRYPFNVQMPQHFSGEIEPPLIEPKAEDFVGIVGIIAIVLQSVGLNLIGNTIAAAFLVEVEQHATAILGHISYRAAQLVAAIAFQ